MRLIPVYQTRRGMKPLVWMLFLFLVVGALPAVAAEPPWKGFAILGNGRLCAVYSDDPRVAAQTGRKGIQHFYFNGYAADYIAGTSVEALNAAGVPLATVAERTGMGTFFRTRTDRGVAGAVECFVHPGDAAILACVGVSSARFRVAFRTEILTDEKIMARSLEPRDGMVVARWSNGTVIAVGALGPGATVTVNGDEAEVVASAANGPLCAIVPGASEDEARAGLDRLRADPDPRRTAERYWNDWMRRGIQPRGVSAADRAAFQRNLYCVKAANLRGQIPADITGQFVTNNMPQLYPRDAMMCARVFLLTGHPAEAREVIEFWARKTIPTKSPGEWFARYDAKARAVDGGSGARYDVPEWDANGYYIQLLDDYHRRYGTWLADWEFIRELADFLVRSADDTGLLLEGGIVEWPGYLPATNMTCAAALETAARIAAAFGDRTRAETYRATAKTISGRLNCLFDKRRGTYADTRFLSEKEKRAQSGGLCSRDKTFLWDTSANFGIVWGYPNHPRIARTNRFYQRETVKLGGGVQYFEAPDPGLGAYGNDVFFFTTAAAAQYHSLYGDRRTARKHIDWMMKNANSYGLMPERIFLNQTDCSPASPLSWCSAEFAAALLLWSRRAR